MGFSGTRPCVRDSSGGLCGSREGRRNVFSALPAERRFPRLQIPSSGIARSRSPAVLTSRAGSWRLRVRRRCDHDLDGIPNVRPGGLSITGTGLAHVTTAPWYVPGAAYQVSGVGEIVADNRRPPPLRRRPRSVEPLPAVHPAGRRARGGPRAGVLPAGGSDDRCQLTASPTRPGSAALHLRMSAA